MVTEPNENSIVRAPVQRAVLHVDMDAFFAAVEVRDRPELAGSPVVVCGPGRRGVALSATYEARSFGVRAAMPTDRAKRMCPGGIVVPPRFDAYRAASKSVMQILGDFSPVVEQASLDEAYVDVTSVRRLFGDSREIGEAIRRRVSDELGLPASVGAGPTKTVAKLASARAKPDGLLVIDAPDVPEFMDLLAVGDLPGVGPATLRTLEVMGIRRVADLSATPRETLIARLGRAHGSHLYELARGNDDRPVEVVRPVKSLSSEKTFDNDLVDEAEITLELFRLSEGLARRLRRSDLAGRTLSIKVRLASMKTLTRSRTLDLPTDLTGVISEISRELYEGLALDRPRIRLLGVTAGGLSRGGAEGGRLPLDEDHLADWRAAERVSDEVRGRFGDKSIGIASLADGFSLRE